MFEDIKWILDNILGINGKGFVIRKNVSTENIETKNGEAVADEKTRTCALCVALNETVFKNDNKPEYYHPNCKCKQEDYNLTHVTFDFPIDKVTKYLFVNQSKKEMMRSMGYTIEDSYYLYELIKENIEKSFLDGNYKLEYLNNHGQHFEINIVIEGKRDHINEKFNCYTGCVAWPYGKIKIATPLLKK